MLQEALVTFKTENNELLFPQNWCHIIIDFPVMASSLDGLFVASPGWQFWKSLAVMQIWFLVFRHA